ncbi:MAG: dTDP-4-dehydrorhamnose 3,5-epimerase [Saprospiraceae bacterium]|nr:dTDP-4-dehydrorhamnose 3,5-epimerase [Saprospiraceae bacterium]
MPFIETEFPGLTIFEPHIWEDDRGYFYESYNLNSFKAAGINKPYVQDNQARSTYGVLRGLHYQIGEHAQGKLVRVIEGSVLDVVVDLREGSPTYGKHFSIELSLENKRQLFVPRGFAHGYVVLTETAEFFYKCDNFFNKESEGGILYNDPQLNIDWKVDLNDVILSEKDKLLPVLGEHRGTFSFN